MATLRFPEYDAASADEDVKVYSLCFFDTEWVVPAVELLDACSDAEAIALARNKRPADSKELWDRHRLVARISPSDLA